MASSSNAEKPPHLECYAFNVFGWAIDLGDQPRTLHQKITTFPVSSRTYKMEIESPEEKKLSTSRALREITEQEIADADPGRAARCLLVGVALYGKDSLEIYGKVPKGIKLRSQPIGTSLNDHQLVPMDGLQVLRVVVQITPDAPLASKFYALLEDKDVLAMPFTISHDEVYYFSEFRDWAYNVRGRRAQWNAKIKLYSVENTSMSSSASSSASSSVGSSTLDDQDSASLVAGEQDETKSLIQVGNYKAVLIEVRKKLEQISEMSANAANTNNVKLAIEDLIDVIDGCSLD